MENQNPANPPNDGTNSAQPEELKVRNTDSNGAPQVATNAAATVTPLDQKNLHRKAYRPSHKATFIALTVVIVILAINAAVLGFILKNKSKDDSSLSKNKVTISGDVLNQLGVNSTTVGNSGIKLTVGPDAEFKGKVTIAGDVAISGQLKLNNKFSAADASFTQLEAGKTSLSQLSVNGDGNFHGGINVGGKTQLQGAVTITKLLTVSNSVNVSGNLAVGGTLSAGSFSAHTLTSNGSLTVNGHLLTGGQTPGVSAGGHLGSNGTVSISGNDTAGVVAVNIGVGGTAGNLANVSFRSSYGRLPRVVVTPVGAAASFYLTSLSVGGFGIGVTSGLPPGGYLINYIVMQ
jgi:predicted acyltransferase (DUF342 family)